MKLFRGLRCFARWHRWGPVVGDDRGVHRTCTYCGTTKRITGAEPRQATDMSGIHP